MGLFRRQGRRPGAALVVLGVAVGLFALQSLYTSLISQSFFSLPKATQGSTEDTHARAKRLLPPLAAPDPVVVRARCSLTKGDWCGRYDAQTPIPAMPPPRGTQQCLWGCNFVGVCDGLTGWCRCPAGWTGDDCSTRMKRPCSQHMRRHGFEPYNAPTDPSMGGLTMACADLYDEDVARCYCNSTFAHGRIPPEPSAPPGMPPQRHGRLLPHNCRRNTGWGGQKSEFGTVDYDKLYGPEGWCQADQPAFRCGCTEDGWDGPTCEEPHEAFCVNQCNGHGECQHGFCKCHPGWFGHDCAYRMEGTPWTPGLEDTEHP